MHYFHEKCKPNKFTKEYDSLLKIIRQSMRQADNFVAILFVVILLPQTNTLFSPQILKYLFE